MATRLENLLHYIITVVPPEQLGATKLAKIVWFSDIESYRLNGQTITQSDSYQRRDQGPLHIDFNRCLSSLKQNKKISERAAPTPKGVRREFVWLEPANVDAFSGSEIAIVHKVINSIIPMSAEEASDSSHGEPWDSAFDRETLPVSAAAVIWGEVGDDVMKWAEEIAALDEHRAPT